MHRVTPVALAIVAALLAGCSATTPPIGAGSTASPRASLPAFAIVAEGYDSAQQTGRVLDLLDPAGGSLATIALTSPADFTSYSGVTPHGIYVVTRNVITLYSGRGRVLASHPLPDSLYASAPVFNSDSTQWIWTVNTTLPGEPERATTVHRGSASSPDTVIGQFTEPAGMQRLDPVAWRGGRVYLTDYAQAGSGHPLPRTNGSGAWTLDPTSGALQQVRDATCALQDVDSSGALLCLLTERRLLQIVAANGLPMATLGFDGDWTWAGNARFSPDATHIVLSTAYVAEQTRSLGVFTGPAAGGAMTAVAGAATAFYLPQGTLETQAVSGGAIETGAGPATPVPVHTDREELLTAILTAPQD